MSFTIFSDGTANLPGRLLEHVTLLPCTYIIDEVPHTYLGDVDHFDAHAYYQQLSGGKHIKTSLLNTQLFLEHFTPELEAGRDVIYVAMSSGISGTYNAARIAAEELSEEYPDRTVRIIDSHGCGFGSGMLVVRAAELQAQGMECTQAADILDAEVPHMCQYFTVDDLHFLKRTGRVSGPTAMIGSVLNIKPILYGTADGQIVSCAKTRGRAKAIEALAEKYARKAVEPQNHRVYISHGDCLEDAQALAQKIQAAHDPCEIVICPHEPFSGAHVGPGMLGLFFYGSER